MTLAESWIYQVVNTARYPIGEPADTAWQAEVARARHALGASGCHILSDFFVPEVHEILRRECAQIAPLAHFDVEIVNAYNIATDTQLPPGHPGRSTMERGNAFVARDCIPPDALVHRLYTSDAFRHFVAGCFGLPRVYELADPLAGLCLNMIDPGRSHPWHFDTNEFTVSTLTQLPQSGGEFEFCPNIRSANAENFDDVRAVLTGRGEHLIQRLTLRPGDLLLFKGRYSLHQVRPVHGDQGRHSAIFAYSERPGIFGSVVRTRQLFGRVLPEHLAAENHTARADQLLN